MSVSTAVVESGKSFPIVIATVAMPITAAITRATRVGVIVVPKP